MVAAPGGIGQACAPVRQWAYAHANARVAIEWRDLPQQHDRAEEASVFAPAWGEVDDLHSASMPIMQHGAQHGSVVQVGLLAVVEIFQFDGMVTAVVFAR